MHIFTSRSLTAVLIVSVSTSAAVLAACGDDDSSDADPVTHDEWFEALCARMSDGGPDFDAFFAEYPEPTLDDWAAFLPEVVVAMDDMYAAVVETPAAPEDEAALEVAAAAIETVRDNFAGAAAAAAAGDAAELARLEEKNQGTDVPAMEAAMGAVETRDCSSGEG